MSIQTEINRISSAKDAIKTAIGDKGVTVPSATKLDGCAALVDQIQATRCETVTVTCSTDQAGVSVAGQILTINGKNYTVPSNGVVTAQVEEGFAYDIVANDKDGYKTPAKQTYLAQYGSRSVTMQWTKIPYGVLILYTDGSLSNYDTKVSGKTTVGVVLVNDYVSLVLHPTEGPGEQWSTNKSTTIPGVTTTTNLNTAMADYAGLANTNAAFASSLQGSAFNFAREAVYADGRQGYLPACGEMEQIRLNADNINTALNLIGGTKLSFSSKYYWSSTQYDYEIAWYWAYGGQTWRSASDKSQYFYCRSVAAFNF